jgi:predicted ester cyclase
VGTSEEHKAVFRRFVEQGPNKANVDAVDDAWDEDTVIYPPMAPEPVRGREALKEMMKGNLAVWSDVRIQIDDLIAEGDQVVALVTFNATNTGEIMGQPATGRSVSFQVAHFLRFSGNRIVEDRQVTDSLALLTQLGLAPTAEPA